MTRKRLTFIALDNHHTWPPKWLILQAGHRAETPETKNARNCGQTPIWRLLWKEIWTDFCSLRFSRTFPGCRKGARAWFPCTALTHYCIYSFWSYTKHKITLLIRLVDYQALIFIYSFLIRVIFFGSERSSEKGWKSRLMNRCDLSWQKIPINRLSVVKFTLTSPLTRADSVTKCLFKSRNL